MKASELTYAHCIQLTIGKPDAFPFTRYEKRTVPVFVHYSNDLEFDDWTVEYKGVVFGEGDTEEKALIAAEYELMRASRATVIPIPFSTFDIQPV